MRILTWYFSESFQKPFHFPIRIEELLPPWRQDVGRRFVFSIASYQSVALQAFQEFLQPVDRHSNSIRNSCDPSVPAVSLHNFQYIGINVHRVSSLARVIISCIGIRFQCSIAPCCLNDTLLDARVRERLVPSLFLRNGIHFPRLYSLPAKTLTRASGSNGVCVQSLLQNFGLIAEF